MSIFAGLLIGTGGLVYLRVGGLVGAIMFAFGLLCVVMCGAQLFTGKSGFLPYKDWPKLILMILLNAVGCTIAAFIARYVSNDTVATNLAAIINARSNASWHSLLVTSAGTGMIMTLAVYGARKKHFLPLQPPMAQMDNGKPILPMEQLESFCYTNKILMGIITVPADQAQQVCDKLIACGIKAVWTFAPVHLDVPPHILVQNENMATSLALLSMHLQAQMKERK